LKYHPFLATLCSPKKSTANLELLKKTICSKRPKTKSSQKKKVSAHPKKAKWLTRHSMLWTTNHY